MTSSAARPLRADAVRNRARLLQVAYETFAAEGLSVKVEEIARRAGVGSGTVYRHFPTKQALFQAVIAERMRLIVDEGSILLTSGDPGEALFAFLRSMVLRWGAADRGLVEALAGAELEMDTSEANRDFRKLLGDLLHTARQAKTVRDDVGVEEIKALLVGCQAMQLYDAAVAEQVTDIALEALRRR